jgi:Bax protein
MIPGERTGTSTHRVRSFSRLIESVWGYTVNLNSHKAYAGFRERRAAIRAAGQTPRGDDLAAELVAYSQQGPAYVALLRRLITENDLGALDTARLDRTPFIGS